MRIIFDLGHPAHFHLFKNVIRILKDSGNDIEIIARQKDCLLSLLQAADFSYYVVPIRKTTLFGKGVQNLKTFAKALSLSRKKKTDFLVGTSLVIGPVARVTGSVSLAFSEDDADVIPLFAKLVYPFVHYIVTPKSLNREDHGKKHIRYQGYHELAYLHPNRFTPNPEVLKELGVAEGQRYFLIRLVSLTAHHDINAKGVSAEQAIKLVKHLSKHGKVFISSERDVVEDLQKYVLPTKVEQIFDVMAFADMVIGDSQSMALEAAILGTPSIRCNTFVGRLSCMEELEHKYGLTAGFLPSDFDKILVLIDKWLAQDDLKKEWAKKREKMLNECVELTDWLLDLFADLYQKRNREKNEKHN